MPHVGNWYKRDKIEADIRERCRALYLENRSHLAEIILRDCAADLQDVDLKGAEIQDLASKVNSWLVSWEVPERQAKRRAKTHNSPEVRLAEQVQQVEEMKANLDFAQMGFKETQSEFQAQNIARFYRLWTESKKELVAIEREIEASEDTEKERDPYWKGVEKRVYNRLVRDYRGKGEVYRSLCGRLASLQVSLLRLEEQGQQTGEAYARLQTEFTAGANQLQKFTEAQKMDLNETHVAEIGTRLMRVIEQRLFAQPALLDQIYADLAGNMDAVIEGKVLRLPERASA